ncbi:MAG: winged helix-turn-helix transcriptional regulator [Hyphomicrobiaceae bacterium]|nr:winged helix-turn-helix transcriptional regulator [Hyphomicrobiaceae bacterium]MCC0024580.1 winged helix-turn-helix transcriptional regulator [Hyphomicrobiaceae bacterium]
MQDDLLAVQLRALGHPVRLSILRLLAQTQNECCCASVVDQLPLAQSTVSQHIKVLLDAGLIERCSKGTRNYYVLSAERFEAVSSAFSGLADGLTRSTRLEATE